MTQTNVADKGVGLSHLAVVPLFLTLFACAIGMAPPALAGQPVRLVLQWYPQTQFAGYYMAREKGIYERYGLDVEIVPGGSDMDSLQEVVKGNADFGTAFLASAIELRSKGVPLVNVAQFVQRSALMLVARKDSGIESVKDLNGKRIGTWGNQFLLQPKALFQREDVSVTFVRQSASFELFMRGGVDAVTAMWYNEYHRLMSYGLAPEDMVTFFFSDLGLNQPEDGIYCLETALQKSPEVATKLIQATVEGWEYTFAHPEESVDTLLKIMKEAKVRANKAHQTWMLARMQNLILSEGQTHLDVSLDRADFENTKQVLLDTGVMEKDIDYNDFRREVAQ